jgi:hypothetical protein
MENLFFCIVEFGGEFRKLNKAYVTEFVCANKKKSHREQAWPAEALPVFLPPGRVPNARLPGD